MNNAAKNVHFKRNIINPSFRLPGSSGNEGERGGRVITWEGLDGDLAGLFEKGTFRLEEELIYICASVITLEKSQNYYQSRPP